MSTLKQRAERAHAFPRALATLSTNDQRALLEAALHGLEIIDAIKGACRRALDCGGAIDPATLLAWLNSETITGADHNGN